MNRKLVSILVLILGLFVILIPSYLLPVCPPMEAMKPTTDGHTHAMAVKFMTCHWTERAEIGCGALIILLAVFMLLAKSAQVRLGISLSLIGIALLVGAIPTVLIGVCPGEMMQCHMGTLPGLLLVSGALLILTVINSIYLYKKA